MRTSRIVFVTHCRCSTYEWRFFNSLMDGHKGTMRANSLMTNLPHIGLGVTSCTIRMCDVFTALVSQLPETFFLSCRSRNRPFLVRGPWGEAHRTFWETCYGQRERRWTQAGPELSGASAHRPSKQRGLSEHTSSGGLGLVTLTMHAYYMGWAYLDRRVLKT